MAQSDARPTAFGTFMIRTFRSMAAAIARIRPRDVVLGGWGTASMTELKSPTE